MFIQEQQEWEVEKILDSQCHRNQIQYRVKWTISTTPIVSGIPPATLRTHPTSSASSTRNTLRNPPHNSENLICPPLPQSTPMKAGPLLAAAAPLSFPSQPPPITNKPNYPPTNPTMTGALPPPRPTDGTPLQLHLVPRCLPQDRPVPTTMHPCTERPATMTTATPTARARTKTTTRA